MLVVCLVMLLRSCLVEVIFDFGLHAANFFKGIAKKLSILLTSEHYTSIIISLIY